MTKKLENNSESLIDLLTEQCADLENLLSLAREETDAAKQGDFARIIDIYEERSELGERLETFQQQITDLRATLGQKVPATISNKISEVVNQTLAQDTETRKLLTAANDDTVPELSVLKSAAEYKALYQQTKERTRAGT